MVDIFNTAKNALNEVIKVKADMKYLRDMVDDARTQVKDHEKRITKLEANLDPFYVFPVNGYEFLYSREVGDSTESYRQVFESIFDTWGDEETATDIVNDLLRFTYVSEDLSTGINTGAEIIFYSIPHYFAIRESCVESYDSLLTSLI